MANITNSLSPTKWLYKCHIVIIRKYRRKVIYNKQREDIRALYKYKRVGNRGYDSS